MMNVELVSEGIDYNGNQTTLTISPEQNYQACFNLSIINDDMFEVNEDFFIRLTSSDPDVFINTPSARVVIEDEDSKLSTR